MSFPQKKIPLLRKKSIRFLWISLVLAIASTICLFFYVKQLLANEVEEELRSTEARVENSITENHELYQIPPVIEISPVSFLGKEKIKDTLIFDPSQNEIEEFRELTTFSKINGENYRITVRALIVESEDILIAVIISYLIIIFFIFVFLFYLNKASNRNLWLPFFTTLEQVKLFSITSEAPISLMESDILEFSELNTEITTLTDKVRLDYKNLKQFTEDVSHELQTPLAIIQAKVDSLINGENLNNLQFEQLSSIQNDIHRLKQLNKRLGLLTKIDNKQFENITACNLNKLILHRIENFSELYPAEIVFKCKEDVVLQMDENLAIVLCDNLLSNAIKYALPNSEIVVELNKKNLKVINKGVRAIIKPDHLFQRFYKESDEIKSTGLGLAIVKKICDHYNFLPSYSYENNAHVFAISFSN